MTPLHSVILFLVSLGNSVDKALADGHLKFNDLFLLGEPMSLAGNAYQNFKSAVNDFKSLTPEKRAELIAFANQNLELKSQRTEEDILHGLEMIASAAYFFRARK
jgi:hypothetical protein